MHASLIIKKVLLERCCELSSMKGKGKGKSGEWRWQPVQHDRSCGQQSRSGGWEPSSWATFGGSGSSGSALRRDESPAPSQASSRSRAAGDSVVEEEDIGWDPYGDASPPKLAKGKCTSPPAVAGEVQPMRHANFNDRDEVGNIGFSLEIGANAPSSSVVPIKPTSMPRSKKIRVRSLAFANAKKKQSNF